MAQPYTPPSLELDAFNCPYCGAYAKQYKHTVLYSSYGSHLNTAKLNEDVLMFSECARCNKHVLWIGKIMLYPISSIAPIPHDDLPENVIKDFNEARNIVGLSPRGATALLRLALQKLMVSLGEKGENINEDIRQLVAKGLPVQIQQALDTVRVVGNNAVHPGQMDLTDDTSTALALFGLLNLIVETMITQPKRIAEMYSSLPQPSLDAIKKRDGIS